MGKRKHMANFLKRAIYCIARGSAKACSGSSAEAIAVLTRGHTGRKVTVDIDYRDASKWAEEHRCLLLPYVRGSWRFRRELRSIEALHGDALVAFRGRPDDGTVKGWEQMGPPPSNVASDGRYNRQGRPMLYLCDSEDGVRHEVGTDGKSLCIQKYKVDLSAILLADLASPKLSNFVRAVFDLAESCKVPGRPGRQDYAFSHTVAKIVEGAGFDGIIVSGVRGNPSQQYRNVVIFRPGQLWRAWSARDAGFKRLPRT